MPLKKTELYEVDALSLATIAGLAAIAAKLAYNKYKKNKDKKILDKYGLKGSEIGELIPTDVKYDVADVMVKDTVPGSLGKR